MTPHSLQVKGIIAPVKGWEPQTYYLVKVAYSSHNIIHRSIFYSGFLNGPNNTPGGYNEIWTPFGDRTNITNAYYLKVIRKLNFTL